MDALRSDLQPFEFGFTLHDGERRLLGRPDDGASEPRAWTPERARQALARRR